MYTSPLQLSKSILSQDFLDYNAYWYVGGQIFFNKFLAHQEAKRTNGTVEFYFYDNILDKVDWTKEPTQNWDDLLAMRAIEIGKEYDYIRLFFSGGRDSRIALNTLVKHKIPINEIVVFKQFEKEPLLEYREAMDLIYALSDKYVHMPKVTTISYDLAMHKKRWQRQDWWEVTKGPHMSFTACQGGHWLDDFPELQEPYQRGHRVCNITGHEKCKLWQKNENLYCTMVDKAIILIVGLDNHEPFFISRKVPELYAKQAWGVKKWLDDKYPDRTDDFVNHEISSASNYPYYEEFCQSQYRSTDVIPHMSDAGKIAAGSACNFLHKDADITKIDEAPFSPRWKLMYNQARTERTKFWLNYVNGIKLLRNNDTFRGFFTNDEPYNFDIGTLSKMHYMGPNINSN